MGRVTNVAFLPSTSLRIDLPLYVMIPRKKKDDKKWIANLNVFRNTHYWILDEVKKLYVGLVRESILLKYGRLIALARAVYSCAYTLYPASKRTIDIMNPCSVIDKFTCDALVELGVFPDDNSKVISHFTFDFGAIDNVNPRCELLIEEYDV